LKKHWERSRPVAIGVRMGDMKAVYYYKTKNWEMFDLKDDPGEHKNIFDPKDSRFLELARQLEAYHAGRNHSGKIQPAY
jgi:hypothetical protein